MGIVKDYIIEQMNQNPVEFSKSPLGKLILGYYKTLPSSYATQDYATPHGYAPIKIYFSGAGDCDLSHFTSDILKHRYPKDKNTFLFGHQQLQDALRFAKGINKERPVIVYGHSWGSNAAKDFVNTSGLNIISAHFLDPMRKDLQDGPQLPVDVKTKVTYTEALPIPGQDLQNASLRAIRWGAPKGAKVLIPVQNHRAVAQWLHNLDSGELQKAASLRSIQSLAYIIKQARSLI